MVFPVRLTSLESRLKGLRQQAFAKKPLFPFRLFLNLLNGAVNRIDARNGRTGTTHHNNENSLAKFKDAEAIDHPEGPTFNKFASASGHGCEQNDPYSDGLGYLQALDQHNEAFLRPGEGISSRQALRWPM
ncbi:hypothetical protein CBI55_04495 [Pseudomonas syringae]|nr:hypothetical protein CBI55_04495 [Pseudomonas syringae]POP80799.1 hypothetical protein CXB38_14975 [Pseudomonas syringae]